CNPRRQPYQAKTMAYAAITRRRVAWGNVGGINPALLKCPSEPAGAVFRVGGYLALAARQRTEDQSSSSFRYRLQVGDSTKATPPILQKKKPRCDEGRGFS